MPLYRFSIDKNGFWEIEFFNSQNLWHTVADSADSPDPKNIIFRDERTFPDLSMAKKHKDHLLKFAGVIVTPKDCMHRNQITDPGLYVVYFGSSRTPVLTTITKRDINFINQCGWKFFGPIPAAE